MSQRAHRILCVNSSPLHLPHITHTLRKAGFEVWTAEGAGDALCMVSGLDFDALVMDQESSDQKNAMWQCLSECRPDLPVLVHSSSSQARSLCGEDVPKERGLNPEVVLAMLVLMFGDPRVRHAAHAAAA